MFSLSAYTVTINKFGSKEIEQLDCFDGVTNFSEVFHEFLKSRLGSDQTITSKKRILRFHSVDSHSHLGFCCKVQTGEYGFTSDLYDTGTKLNAHVRTKVQAEMLPFYIYAHFPKGVKRGALIFQRFKQFGVRGYLMDQFLPYFSAKFPNYSLKIQKAVPAVVLEKLIDNGHVKTFRFIKRQAPSDLCDALGNIDQDGVAAEIEYVIKAKRKGYFGKLDPLKKEFKKKVPDFKSLVEIPNFDYDTIKVDLEMGGRRRSIDLGNMMKISGTIDITDDAVTDSSGHPTKASFTQLAKDLVNTLF